MNRRRPKRQLELFPAVPQDRFKEPESDRIYSAILKLRRAGRKVFRAGKHCHLVSTSESIFSPRLRKVTTPELIELAATVFERVK